uniref:Uncharacterized protein n=1 Tax=Siphoviridae sp. ctC4e1 TaxID=2825375 RepID=A0A8S5VI82_9CAUD|nr:MAG TPA: hypothetical protein [Siphoviridae sp. ctC4e1]
MNQFFCFTTDNIDAIQQFTNCCFFLFVQHTVLPSFLLFWVNSLTLIIFYHG